MNDIFIEGIQNDIEYIEAKVAYNNLSGAIKAVANNDIYAESLSGVFASSKLIGMVLKIMSALLTILKKIYVVVIGVILKKIIEIGSKAHRATGGGSFAGLEPGKTYTIPINVVDADVEKGLEDAVPNDISNETTIPLAGMNNDIEKKYAMFQDNVLKHMMSIDSLAKEDLHRFIDKGNYTDTRTAMFNILFISLNSKLESLTEDININKLLISMEEYNTFMNNLVLCKKRNGGFMHRLIFFSYKDSYDILGKIANNSNDVKPFHTIKELAQPDIQALSKVRFFSNAQIEGMYADIYKGLTGDVTSNIETTSSFVNRFIIDILVKGLDMTRTLSEYFDASYNNLYDIDGTGNLHKAQDSLTEYFKGLNGSNSFKHRRRHLEQFANSKRKDPKDCITDYATNYFFNRFRALFHTSIKERLSLFDDLARTENISSGKCEKNMRIVRESLNKFQSGKCTSIKTVNDVGIKLLPFTKDSRYTSIFVIPTALDHEKSYKSYPSYQYFTADNFLRECDMSKTELREAVARVSQNASDQSKIIRDAQNKIKKAKPSTNVDEKDKQTLSQVCTTVTSLLGIIESSATTAHTISMVHYETINSRIVDLYIANYKLIVNSMMRKLAEKIPYSD